ncbi:bifunctional helix-turn-helix transcriptional regulator/GNAT family N-acetyltransferase [Brevundimonas diminuta]|uniref:bifunctional helix-turn-helix transcriptional regulator/GNAT family N-acetyltransferase n=1 Tax=Brevundimonas diminuta TaxID=293 RepID=UPI003208CC7D
MPDSIARIRRFQRAVTTEVGALDESFLGRGRPMGVARVLNAIGGGKTEVSEVRRYLGLDSGLMSRLLRTLEAERLIEIDADEADNRRRRVRLTAEGAREYAAYEALADAQARAMLDRHASPRRLLEAMDLIASTLGRDRITLHEVPPQDADAQACMTAYYAELSERLERGFDVALSKDPDARDMIRPRGAFVVAMSDGMAVGCAGLKGTDLGYAEIKRLWVSPRARGLGLALRLMDELERIAVELNIRLLRLDTNSALKEAVALYANTGWQEIARFNDDPYPDRFFEKALAAGAEPASRTA